MVDSVSHHHYSCQCQAHHTWKSDFLLKIEDMTFNIMLSGGAVARLMKGGQVDKPVFQVLGIRKIPGRVVPSIERYRLKISDGDYFVTFALLATQLNPLITSGEVDNLCVIRCEKFVANLHHEKPVFVIVEMSVIVKGATVGQRLGNPVHFTEATTNVIGAGPDGNDSGYLHDAASAQPVKPESSDDTAAYVYGQQQKSKSVVPLTVSPSQDGYISFVNTGITDDATAPAAHVPIQDITPYHTRSIIKARVISKSGVRSFSNSRRDGKLFTMDLKDETGEIRMTGFNDAVDRFYDIIKVNEVYIFTKFSTKPANKQFTSLKHDFEISLRNDTQVTPCLDSNAEAIPSLQFDFIHIDSIENCQQDEIIDVIGVCRRQGDLQTVIIRKNGKELKKRDIFLVDPTNFEVPLTLWGKQAEDFEDDSNPVVALKGVKVTEFYGKSLSCLNTTVILLNPDLSRSHNLRDWFAKEGINAETKSLQGQRGGGGGGIVPWKLIGEIKIADPGAAGSSYYFMSKVSVLGVKKENSLYKACPEESCKKKVFECENGKFRCEKCAKEYPMFKWRMILNVTFADCSDSIWATCFQEHGEMLLNTKTDVLGPLHQEDKDAFDGIIKQALFKSYTAKFFAKMETYNNENRLKFMVMDIQPINHAEYARKLLAEIKETMG